MIYGEVFLWSSLSYESLPYDHSGNRETSSNIMEKIFLMMMSKIPYTI